MAYLMYGVLPASVPSGHAAYEQVEMTGKLFLKLEGKDPQGHWITLALGALCPTANGDPVC